MTKVTHTHRGHCQKCLRVHAIDVGTGLLAKHGYTVDGGYFSGECAGSGVASLHVNRDLTDAIIRMCDEDSKNLRAHIAKLEAGAVFPRMAHNGEYIKVTKTGRRGNTYTEREEVMVPFADAPEMYRREAVRQAIWNATRTAEQAEHHAKQMREWVVKIYEGKVPAYRNEQLDNGEWTVGDTVRIGGKKGFDAVIEAIENQEYKTYGWRRGRQTLNIPHGRVTRPAITEKKDKSGYVTRSARPELTYWEALRNIKRPASKLVEELKKAGLI
jgi:hypothetical protein